MKRILFSNREGKTDKIDYILKSQRQYQTIVLVISNKEVESNTNTLRKVRSIVNKFSESVIILGMSHDLQRTSELPKLKKLIYLGSGEDSHRLIVANGLLTKVSNLQEFVIKKVNLGKSSLKDLVNSLKEISTIKFLKTDDHRIIDALSAEEVTFQLAKFYVDDLNNFGLNNNISNFINTFRSSLNIVHGPIDFQDVLNLMTNFPKLQLLVLYNQVLSQQEEMLEIQLNETIEVFTVLLTSINVNDHFYNNLDAIMSKMGKLETLITVLINPRILTIILACNSLKYVRYCYLQDMSIDQLSQVAASSNKTFIPISAE
jgi:hypothetical protein